MDILDEELRTVEASDIALVTFTRAGAREARERALQQLPLTDDDLVWFRTIHSMAFRLLELKREDVLSAKDIREFADRYGYHVSVHQRSDNEDEVPEFTGQSEDDWLFSTYDYTRNVMQPAQNAPAKLPTRDDDAPGHPSIQDSQERLQRYREFVERYKEFKGELGKNDFHDMLESCLGVLERPPVSVAIIDEAQDLSPIQIALAEKWFAPCKRVYVAGDDDQTIFSWAGADPTWVIGLSKTAETVDILDQSYRVPQMAHALAQEIIERNDNRVPKTYHPREERGDLHIMHPLEAAIALRKDERRAFVLARNWYILEDFAKDLTHRGVPFIVEHHPHWSPLGRPKVIDAVRVAMRLRDGRPVSRVGLEKLLDFIPSLSGPKGHKVRHLPHGFKKKVSELSRNEVDVATLREWGFGKILDAITEHGPTSVLLRNVKQERKDAIQRLIDTTGEIPHPRVTLTTMHRCKGRERPVVVLLSDMSKSSWEEYMDGAESENRVAYVAVTRTKETLVVCRPTTDYSYPYARFARAILDNPPQEIPSLTVEQAHALLEDRQHPDVEEAVVTEWLDITSHARLYPELRKVARRFDTISRALAFRGMPEADARWAAYLYCSPQSR